MKIDWLNVDSCLILSMRHLGDSVILAGFINAIRKKNPRIHIDVLGRAQLREITCGLAEVDAYLTIEIPAFAFHKRTLTSMSEAVETLYRVRRRRYDLCINLMGDARENLIAGLSKAQLAVAPKWPEAHPFRQHIRDSRVSFGNRTIDIPASFPEFYRSISYFARQLDLPDLAWLHSKAQHVFDQLAPVIALHPGASQPAKQWDFEKWRNLINHLATKNRRIRLFGAPFEEERLKQEFHTQISQLGVECVTGDIGSFFRSLRSTDLLIGMDSFSVHAAYALGVPAVLLNGPFDFRVMTPPGDTPLSAGHLCQHFPCNNGAFCKNAGNPYVCVRGIEVSNVLAAVEEILTRKGLETRTFDHI